MFSELVDAQSALAQMKKQDMAKEQQLKDYKLKCENMESNQASLQTEISSLKKKKMNTPDNVDGPGLQQLMRKELETFQTNLVEDLNTKMNHTKNLTEKKWSDLFKSNKDDLKDQKKQANMERKTLEKTIADNKRQTLVDNLERQKRASNICVSNVAESINTDKNAKDKEDRGTIIDILQMKESDVKHVFRAGAVQDKPRPLIIVLASPELARTKHDYGKGRPIRDKEGRNILYWINPDLIKADRFANYKARLAKSKKAENDKVVKTENDKVVKTENDKVVKAENDKVVKKFFSEMLQEDNSSLQTVLKELKDNKNQTMRKSSLIRQPLHKQSALYFKERLRFFVLFFGLMIFFSFSFLDFQSVL